MTEAPKRKPGRPKGSKNKRKPAADNPHGIPRGAGRPQKKEPPKPASKPKREIVPNDGQFLPGNRFWEARSSQGPKPIFTDPSDLWDAAQEYFSWVYDHPLIADKIIAFKGRERHVKEARMMAMTMGGLFIFLDISRKSWNNWRNTRPDLLPIMDHIEEIIYNQKFVGAAAEMLNPNIIARELGLGDTMKVKASVEEMTDQEIERRVDDLLEQRARARAIEFAGGRDTEESE